MEMPVDGQPFVSFPALDRADGALKVRGYLLPGIQAIVSRGISKNGDAVAFSSWAPGLPGALPTQVARPEEWMMVTCPPRLHQFLSSAPNGSLVLADALFLLFLFYFLAATCRDDAQHGVILLPRFAVSAKTLPTEWLPRCWIKANFEE